MVTLPKVVILNGVSCITISTKQLHWFIANQRRYAWRGNQRVETGAAAPNAFIYAVITKCLLLSTVPDFNKKLSKKSV